MILMAAAARHANNQILAASSTGEGLKKPGFSRLKGCEFNALDWGRRSDLAKAQIPIKTNKTHDKPPILVFIGAKAKVSAKTANATEGNGR
jgi:hypothetical protein